MHHDPLFFFEQTDFSLRFARCAISETALNIEELKEIAIIDTPALGQLAPAGTQVVCALRPKSRELYLATPDEAQNHPGLAGMQAFTRLPVFAKNDPAWFAGVQASDGTPPVNHPWLMSACSATALQQSRGLFEAIKLKPARCLEGTLATVGAIASAVTSPALILEIGELNSHALLIGPGGVIGLRSVTLNLEQIADAVQKELNLKFRGSAAKLFLNPDCDFSDTGSKIAARLCVALKTDLAPLLAGQPSPMTLCCAGLPALQHWLEVQLAAGLGLAPFNPDIKAWSSTIGVTFASPALAASISPAWFNFLHFINSQTLESPAAVAWQAEWLSVKAPIAAMPAINPSHPGGANRPAKSGSTAPLPVAGSATSTKASAEKPTPPSPTPVIKPTLPPSPPKASEPAPKLATVASVQVKSPVPPKPAPVPSSAKAAPLSSVQYSAKPATSKDHTEKPGKSSKMPLLVGLSVAVIALLGGGYFYLQTQQEEAARLALEKQQSEERIKVETERASLAEQKAREEAERRAQYEAETSRKLALAENARKQAEEEARAQAATRLANARGTLVITTQPAGATVTVGDLPPRTSPATFTFVKIGRYPVAITLAHHEAVKLELEVTENNTTDSGVIALNTLVGSVAVSSDPAGSTFEIRPANSFSVDPDSKRTGQTPATVKELNPGDYIVTFSRPGWAPHSETIAVRRNATTQAAWTFPSGTVKITSAPAGASVSRDGAKLGVTPLTLRQAPGSAQYDLNLAFHDALTLPAVIEEGKTVELNGQLALTDIIFGPSDLDKNPEPINPKTPDLPSSLTLVEGKVVIQMTINRDGLPSDIKLVRASNPEIGKIYLAAVAKWKFKPGMKNGKPVRSAVVIPFLISPS